MSSCLHFQPYVFQVRLRFVWSMVQTRIHVKYSHHSEYSRKNSIEIVSAASFPHSQSFPMFSISRLLKAWRWGVSYLASSIKKIYAALLQDVWVTSSSSEPTRRSVDRMSPHSHKCNSSVQDISATSSNSGPTDMTTPVLSSPVIGEPKHATPTLISPRSETRYIQSVERNGCVYFYRYYPHLA